MPGRPAPERKRPGLSRCAALVLLALLWLIEAGKAASAASPQADLAQGIAEDLAGHQSSAFGLYQRAADAGIAEAQLNVAVMLDSGRGVAADPGKAALYYALAASNGVPRAAYDLGQLYDSGDGVPKNAAMAREWFRRAASSGLGAANGRFRTLPILPASVAGSPLRTPGLLYPAPDAAVAAAGSVSFVWSAPPEPAPASYLLEIMSLVGAPRDVARQVASVSAVSVPIGSGTFAWRVIVFCPSEARYNSSFWSRFEVR